MGHANKLTSRPDTTATGRKDNVHAGACRRNLMVLALAQALGVGGIGAVVAAPVPAPSAMAMPARASAMPLVRSVVSQPHQTTQQPSAAVVSATANTWTVTNCADSTFSPASGSLRWAVGQASSGDTIDMSGLNCFILLDSAITISQDDLTLRGHVVFVSSGGPAYLAPIPRIDAQHGSRVIYHNGAGTLTLDTLDIANGTVTSPGGCISSSGSVVLRGTDVHDCNGDHMGGAVYAQNAVTLNASTVRDSTVSVDASIAYGGGIAAGGDVTVENGSRVRGNVAKAIAPYLFFGGGGIYARGDLAVTDSIIDANRFEGVAPAESRGAGALANGTSTLLNSEVTGNGGPNTEYGGGLYMLGGGTIQYSTIHDNQAESGGGIVSKRALLLEHSTISSNYAEHKGSGLFTSASITIRNSTIADNSAAGLGAAVFLVTGLSAATALIEQSTISGNIATGTGAGQRGAGLYLKDIDTTIKNSTIVGNIEQNSNNVRHGAGIAVGSTGDPLSLTLVSTVVAGNKLKTTASTFFESDIGVTQGTSNITLSGHHNLIGHAQLTPPADTILVDDPELDSLQYNGGFTKTHEPLAGSPLIDAGVANGFSTSDQRGFRRVSGLTADIGAVEYPSDRIFANDFD